MGGNTVECFVKNIEGFLCVYKNSRWKRWGVLKRRGSRIYRWLNVTLNDTRRASI